MPLVEFIALGGDYTIVWKLYHWVEIISFGGNYTNGWKLWFCFRWHERLVLINLVKLNKLDVEFR